MKEKVLSIYKKFFDNLGVPYSDLEIIEKDTNIFLIKLKTDNAGLLIWQNGKNLTAINHIVRMMTVSILQEKPKLYLEINDYLENKDTTLKRFIISKINIVKSNGEDLELPFYSSYERRKIHSFVAEEVKDGSIYTKSKGEGKNRRLHICKKAEKLSIDIDSVDI